jgi:putative hydrolase of the HAD superfamily
MAIRGVIFDYGGVVCFHPAAGEIAEAAELCGVSSEAFVRALWKNRLRYDAGQAPYEYWSEAARLLERKLDAELFAEMVRREINFWMRCDERMLGWIGRLRGAGVRVGLLSNLPSPLGGRVRSNGLLQHFDHVTLSFELGCTKPARRIYEHAVAGLGVAADEALFLDDRPENVAGAREAGLRSELYSSWEDAAGIAALWPAAFPK